MMNKPKLRVMVFAWTTAFMLSLIPIGVSGQTSLGNRQGGERFEGCCDECDKSTCTSCSDIAHKDCGGEGLKANCALFDDDLICKPASRSAPSGFSGNKKSKSR
jgi:hypothetical protein